MAKLSRGYCNRSKKTKFPDAIAAKLALANIQRFGDDDVHHGGKKPIREYRCEFCKGYHLTSQPKNEAVAV